MTNIVKNCLELTMNSEDTADQVWRIYEKRVRSVERCEMSDLFDKGTQTPIVWAKTVNSGAFGTSGHVSHNFLMRARVRTFTERAPFVPVTPLIVNRRQKWEWTC